MVLFVLSRMLKLSLEPMALAIWPWLLPLLLALLIINFALAASLVLPAQLGLVR